MKLIREYTDFQLLIVTPPATSASGGGPDAGAAAAATAVASLRSRQSISAVGVNPIMRIPEQVVVPLSDAPGTTGESSSRGAAVGIKPAQQQNDSCDAGSDPLNPDVNLGRTSEGVPWGIAAVQGTDPVVQQLAQQYRSKVLYCVLDTGLDIANKEFDANSEWRSMRSGCIPWLPIAFLQWLHAVAAYCIPAVAACGCLPCHHHSHCSVA
jgi:hypothetical protein